MDIYVFFSNSTLFMQPGGFVYITNTISWIPDNLYKLDTSKIGLSYDDLQDNLSIDLDLYTLHDIQTITG